MSRLRTSIGLLALLTLLVGATAACGSSSDGSAAGEPSGTAAPGGQAATGQPIVIKFADPGNQGINAYAKKHGSYEAPLAAQNAKIEWVPAAAAFSANFDLLKSGAINTHEAAVSPILGALSRGLPFEIFSISDPTPSTSDGIVATQKSGIKTVADLKGKKVAVNAKAHGEWLLLQALAEAGINPSEVERVPIQPPDAAAAFAAGQIDAWATFGSFFTTAVAGGGVPIITAAQYKSYDDVGVVGATPESLKANPGAYAALVKTYAELSQKARENPEDFVNVFTSTGPSAYQGDVKASAIEDIRVSPIPRVPTADDKARVARVLKLFVDNGVIAGTVNVDDVVFDVNAAK